MSGMSARIEQARTAKGMSQDALAAAVGVTRQAVAGWESGSQPRGESRIQKIADALDVSAGWLLHGPAGDTGRGMPVRGEVAAGTWKEAVDLDLEPIPVLPIPDYPVEAQYGLLVRGTSMNKLAKDGEYLHVVDVIKTGLSLRAGDIVIVHRTRHGMVEATAKMLEGEEYNWSLRFESTDPKYQGIMPIGDGDDDTEIAIVGIVLGKYQRLSRG